jgi:hypothetical protein
MSRDQKTATHCAIYTRKSSEEGLELSTHLDAQREACEAFILRGWSGDILLIATATAVLPTRVGMVRTFPLKTSPAWGEPIPAPDN